MAKEFEKSCPDFLAHSYLVPGVRPAVRVVVAEHRMYAYNQVTFAAWKEVLDHSTAQFARDESTYQIFKADGHKAYAYAKVLYDKEVAAWNSTGR